MLQIAISGSYLKKLYLNCQRFMLRQLFQFRYSEALTAMFCMKDTYIVLPFFVLLLYKANTEHCLMAFMDKHTETQQWQGVPVNSLFFQNLMLTMMFFLHQVIYQKTSYNS